MKKSELTQLTQLIEALVAKEVRKQLPVIIAETFQNMMGKSVVTEQRQPAPVATAAEEELDLKASLREMFAGATPTAPVAARPAAPAPMRQLCKDPVLNKILNETTPLRAHERNMGSMPAFLSQYQTAAMQAGVSMPNPAEMSAAMAEGEPEFAKRMPALPVGTPPVLREGQESSHQPMAAIPDGVSALDVARQVPLAAPVAQALTRNYSQMMKIIDKKKKGVVA
jgi:hypothetical protein